MRSLFTTDQNSGLTSTASIFSTVTTNGDQYANQSVFGIKHNAYLLEGYDTASTSRNIQGVITTGSHTWTQLGGATIGSALALPAGITVTGASLFNAAGAVTPTYKYLAQSNGAAAGLFTADTGDFILMGVTDSATQGTANALDTTFNGASNSIGLGLSDGNGVGQTVSANWAQPSTTINAITTRSAGNAYGGSAAQAGGNPNGWVLVWGRPEAVITPVAAYSKTTTMQFRVDFAAGSATGLDTTDFTVGGSSTGWSVASVTGSGAGPYTVTLNGVAPTQGTVTLSLNTGAVTVGGSSFPTASIPGTAATTYDSVAPTVTSLTAAALTTFTSPITYTLNLSDAPTAALTASNFIVSGTSGGWAVQSLTGSGSGPYTVTVANAAGIPPNGTINLGLRAGSFSDAAGNTGPATQYNASTVTLYRGLDLGTPTVASFTGSTASTATSPLTFSLTFDQLVSGLTTSDFSFGGTSTGWVVASVTGSGTGPYTVTATRASPVPGGTLTLILRSGAVIDRANTQGPLTSANSPVVTVTTKPANTVVPVVTGTATTFGVLTGTSGTWTGPATITYAYQWQVSDDGATGWSDATGAGNATASYATAQADMARYLRLRVTATNSGGATVAYSAATARVMPGASLLTTAEGPDLVLQTAIGTGGALGGTVTGGATGANPRGMAVTPDNGFVYVANSGGNSISQFAVGPSGALTPLSPASVATGAGTTPQWVAVTPDQRFAYVANRGTGTVGQYRVLSDGRLSGLPTVSIAAGTTTESLVVNPAGTVLYAASRGTGEVFQFAIDQASGQLSALSTPKVATSTDPAMIIISPNGQYAYVFGNSSGKVDQFTVGAGGLLTAMAPANVAFSSAAGGVVSPDGRNLYGTSWSGNVLGQWSIGGTGALTALAPASVATSTTPVRPYVAPDDANVYVPNYATSLVSQYTRNAATGLLTAMTPATVTVGANPWTVTRVLPRPTVTAMRTGLATGTAGAMAFTVSFNQWVSGLDAADFSIVGGASGWSVQSVTGSGAGPYTVMVTGSGAGQVNLRMAAGAVTDNLGNTGPSAPRLGIGGVMSGAPQPTVSSVVRVGWATAVTTGDWVGEGNTLAYQWQVSSSASGPWANATGTGNATATYTPVAGDAWQYVRAAVTATALDGTTATMNSAARVVQPAEVLYATNNGSANVSRFTVQADGTLSAAINTAAGTSPIGIATTPNGRYVYVANGGANTISQYSTDDAGALTPLATATIAQTNPYSMASTPDGRFVYVSSYSGNTLVQYSVGATGQLTQIGTVTTGTGPGLVRVTPDGKYVYVSNWTGASLSSYTVNQDTGVLTSLAATAATLGTGPRGLAITPDGQYLYATALTAGKVHQYRINANGSLTSAGADLTLTNAALVTTSPDSRYVYVAQQGSNVLAQFSVGAGGALTAMTPATVALSGTSTDLVPRATGGALYAASGSVFQYSAGGTGALAAMTPATAAAGTTPSRLVTRPLGLAATDIRAVPATASATSLTWKVSFNRPVTGVEASDFALGAAAGSWSVTGVTGSGAGPYTVTASGSGAGTEILTLAAGSVTDLAGTAGPIAARSAASVPVVASATGPTATDAPRLGIAQTGTAGAWVGEGTVTTYQWQVSDDGLGGWTSATGTGNATLTFTPAQADLWKYLRLTVTGTNAAGTGSASSAAAYVAMPDLLFASNNVGNSVTAMSVGASGALTPGTTTSGFTAPRRITTTPDSRFLYVPNMAATGTVSQFAVSETGALTALSPATVSSGASPTGVWVTPNGRYAYATNNSGATVSQYSIGVDGKLTALSPATVAGGTGSSFMTINSSGTRAYVVNRNAGATPATISQYSIGTDGKLTALTAATVSVPNLDPTEMALTPDGRYAYVTSFNTGKVTQYSVGADGALAVLSPSSVSVTSAVGIAVSPDSGSLYVGSWNAASTTSGVYQFTIGANGQLAAKTPAALPSATWAADLLVSPDGKNLYAGGANTSPLVSQYSIGAGGALTALSPTSVTSGGNNPLAVTLVPAQFLAPTIVPSSTSQSATSFTYSVRFTRAVTGLDANDFTVGGTATGWTVQSVTGSGAGPYTVTVGGGTTGTVILSLPTGTVIDVGGALGPVVAKTAATVTVDRGPPSVASFTPALSTIGTTPATYSLTFGEPVTGLTASDISLGGTSSGWTVTGVTGSGAGPYTLTVAASGMPTDGTLIPRLALNAVTDLGGNPGPLFATDATAGNVVLAPQAPQVVGRQGDNLISWTPSSGDNVTGYKVYWGTSATSLSNSATVPGRSSSLFDHTGRTIGTPYFYAVAPVDSAGNEGTRTATVGATPTFTADTRLTCTGAAQTYVVPSGVSWITVDALGARGGENSAAARLASGGKGARTQAVIPVTASESLQVNVGCSSTSVTAGWNGGAAGGGTSGSGGGGATDVRRGGTALANRVLVAGGGGGAGGSSGALNTGGDGGGADRWRPAAARVMTARRTSAGAADRSWAVAQAACGAARTRGAPARLAPVARLQPASRAAAAVAATTAVVAAAPTTAAAADRRTSCRQRSTRGSRRAARSAPMLARSSASAGAPRQLITRVAHVWAMGRPLSRRPWPTRGCRASWQPASRPRCFSPGRPAPSPTSRRTRSPGGRRRSASRMSRRFPLPAVIPGCTPGAPSAPRTTTPSRRLTPLAMRRRVPMWSRRPLPSCRTLASRVPVARRRTPCHPASRGCRPTSSGPGAARTRPQPAFLLLARVDA